MKRFSLIGAILLAFSVAAGAQSKNFTMGKWVETHTAILRELNRTYVDSLEVSRIERAGIDAMLE